MRSTGFGKVRGKEVVEAVVAMSIMLLYVFAAPAVGILTGGITLGAIAAAATFSAGLSTGIAIWSYFGTCAYAGYLIYHYGWNAFNNPAPWVCGAVTVGIA
ncbi:hypothetical protein [Vulcanisaeta sp. JCM 14467]